MPAEIWFNLLVVSLVNIQNLPAQVTIWSEDFSSYSDGATQGIDLNQTNPASDWISGGCITCADSLNDWWEVRSAAMEARDVNMPVYWQTEAINIENYQNVWFSLTIKESGDLEGFYFGADNCLDQANQDYVNVRYRLDGGAWILINNYLNWCGLYDSCNSHTLQGDDGEASGDCRSSDEDFDSVTVVNSGLNGSILEIRVELINSSSEEYITLDNIQVEGDLVLPVRWHSFTAFQIPKGVRLQWQTQSERNSLQYQIMRNHQNPKNPDQWQSLALIPAVGHSDQISSYHFLDTHPKLGKNYYRLRQEDIDGRVSWSGIIFVEVVTGLRLWPNPVSNYLHLEWPENQRGFFRMYDSQGILVIDRIIDQSHLTIYLGGLSNGYYSARIDNQNLVFTQTIVIMR